MLASTPNEEKVKSSPLTKLKTFGDLTPISSSSGLKKRRLGICFTSSKKQRIRRPASSQPCAPAADVSSLYFPLNVSKIAHIQQESFKTAINLLGEKNQTKQQSDINNEDMFGSDDEYYGIDPKQYTENTEKNNNLNSETETCSVLEESLQCGQPTNDSQDKVADDVLSLNHFFDQSYHDIVPNQLEEELQNVLFDSEPFEDIVKDIHNGANVIHCKEKEEFGSGPFFGLSKNIKKLIEKERGITKLYDWQEECLKLACSPEKRNLVYALPTSGGKTLVAEIMILREIICSKKNVLFILPYVAIVQEKVRSLQPLSKDLDFLVEEYAAGKGTLPPKERRRKRSVYVATIEKALAVVQSLIEVGRVEELGLAVVDELHLVGEGSGRGATLETLITFILSCKVHIVGMSATIGNLSEISTFLNAESFTGNFRPVELTEYVKCQNTVYKINYKEDTLLVLDRQLPSSKDNNGDSDHLATLVGEVCPSESVLVFCASKKNCENVAQLLCKCLPDLKLHRPAEKLALLQNMALENNGQTCAILRKCLPYGVAYHHSGLTADERRLLEEAYREGVVCCICCTSTLAAGVNLPAKRVILRAPYVGMSPINMSQYKQMVGRAGRAGLGDKGESFLVCQSKDFNMVQQLLNSKMNDVVSTLTEESCADVFTAAVGLGMATTRPNLRLLLSRTLLGAQAERLKIDVKKTTDKIISTLLKNRTLNVVSGTGAITKSMIDDKLEVTVPNQVNVPKFKVTNYTEFTTTRLARAAMKGCMSLALAKRVYSDLDQAEVRLNLKCDLHLLYLVTPYQMSQQIAANTSVYYSVYSQLTEEEQTAAEIIGLSKAAASKMAMGRMPKNTTVTDRLYCSLMLSELMKQRDVWDVAALFQVPRGPVQSALSSAATFCNNIVRFCEELQEFWALQAILKEFAPRLQFCCETELLPLMDLPSVKRTRARQLHSAGFKTIEDIVRADPDKLKSVTSHLTYSQACKIIDAAKAKVHEMLEDLKEDVDALASLDKLA